MIVQERIDKGDGSWVLVKTYSSEGYLIRQDESGDLYEEAIDPEFTNRTYTETNMRPESDEEEATAEEILDILLGGES